MRLSAHIYQQEVCKSQPVVLRYVPLSLFQVKYHGLENQSSCPTNQILLSVLLLLVQRATSFLLFGVLMLCLSVSDQPSWNSSNRLHSYTQEDRKVLLLVLILTQPSPLPENARSEEHTSELQSQ